MIAQTCPTCGTVRLPAEALVDPPPLSPREQVILRYLSTTTWRLRQIAAAEYVSANTVKTQVRRLYAKLGVRSRRDAVQVARRLGLVPSPGETPPGWEGYSRLVPPEVLARGMAVVGPTGDVL